MTAFVQPPFWAIGQRGRGSVHTGVQFVDDGPVVEPITLDEAKAYLRVTVPDEDADITRFISAARAFCERRTQRPIARHICDVFYDRVGLASWITLPFAPVTAVTRVTTTSLDGVATVVDPATYLVDLASEPARIGLPTGQIWPAPVRAFQGFAVRLALGYDQPPEDLLQALRLMLGHFYEHRLPVQGESLQALPLGVDDLLAPFELVMVV